MSQFISHNSHHSHHTQHTILSGIQLDDSGMFVTNTSLFAFKSPLPLRWFSVSPFSISSNQNLSAVNSGSLHDFAKNPMI